MFNRNFADAVRRLRWQLSQWHHGSPPGHFYSPVPDLAEVKRRESTIFTVPSALPGVALNEAAQLRLLASLAQHYSKQPFTPQKQPGLRYFFDNPNFTYGEAVVLYCLMCLVQPKRIIEIGSGYSSCVFLDTNELVFDHQIDCTFIEPYPELLLSLLKPGEAERVRILPSPVQDVELGRFAELQSGDILFVDSSHVSKVGSDVNWIVFEILPRLADGVYVHFHDVEYPFEYPKKWIYQGRVWNEAYLLRAFLQYNDTFVVELYNSFLGQLHSEEFGRALPLGLKNPGTSLWLRRISSAAS